MATGSEPRSISTRSTAPCQNRQWACNGMSSAAPFRLRLGGSSDFSHFQQLDFFGRGIWQCAGFTVRGSLYRDSK